jgi:hypothetical protein
MSADRGPASAVATAPRTAARCAALGLRLPAAAADAGAEVVRGAFTVTSDLASYLDVARGEGAEVLAVGTAF